MILLTPHNYKYEVAIQHEKDEKTIYVLTDPDTLEVRYVGQAINPYVRFAQHLSTQTSLPMYKWVGSLKAEGKSPRMFVIDHVPSEDADFREQEYIHEYTEAGARLFNVEARQDLKRGDYGYALNDISRLVVIIEHFKRRMRAGDSWEAPTGAYINKNRYTWQMHIRDAVITIKNSPVAGKNPRTIADLIEKGIRFHGIKWPHLPLWQYEKWWEEKGKLLMRRCYRLHQIQ